VTATKGTRGASEKNTTLFFLIRYNKKRKTTLHSQLGSKRKKVKVCTLHHAEIRSSIKKFRRKGGEAGSN
jgi:hypothetical protein